MRRSKYRLTLSPQHIIYLYISENYIINTKENIFLVIILKQKRGQKDKKEEYSR